MILCWNLIYSNIWNEFVHEIYIPTKISMFLSRIYQDHEEISLQNDQSSIEFVSFFSENWQRDY